MKYKLMAIDLDGTLLGPDSRISKTDAEAFSSLQDSGVLIVPCTGRSLTEASEILASVGHRGLCVLVDGAHVFDLGRSETISSSPLEAGEMTTFLSALSDGVDAITILFERPHADSDYLIIGKERLPVAATRHFESLGVIIRERLMEELSFRCLRIGVITTEARVAHVINKVEETMGSNVAGRLMLQNLPGGQGIVKTIELLPDGVNKWKALQAISKENGILPAEIAAIGDSINDVHLVGSVGCGISMGNACEKVLQVAKRRTLPNSDCGFAHATRQLLDGIW